MIGCTRILTTLWSNPPASGLLFIYELDIRPKKLVQPGQKPAHISDQAGADTLFNHAVAGIANCITLPLTVSFSTPQLTNAMPNTPQKKILLPDNFASLREISCRDRRENTYPQLMRLCADFDFHVLQIQRKAFSHISRRIVPGAPEFCLAVRCEQLAQWYSVSPLKESLQALNDYCKTYEIDLLHLQLIGDDDGEVFPQTAFY